MRSSIFDLEIRVDINKEFENIQNVLFENRSLYYSGLSYSLYDFLNDEVFPVWENKGLFLDFDDFLVKIGISFNSYLCDETEFLYLLEVLINLWPLVINTLGLSYEKNISKRVLGYMKLSVPFIIEKLNYQIIENETEFRLIKRDADVDSILELIPSEYSALLLEYNDIRNNNLESKMTVLKKLDKYIESQKNEYKSLDNDTYNSIQFIVNKMGVNHPLKEPYKSIETDELIKWYDKCFKLIIHLIRKKDVNDINKHRKEFEKE